MGFENSLDNALGMKDIMLVHHNGVAGTNIFPDGTKVFWTEGRSSSVTIKYPNGKIVSVSNDDSHPILDRLNSVIENGCDQRPMSPAEETEWEQTYI